MPEEKKDSFTFSDKIKNSKPVPSKSFANRTSKLGSNGKPKKTIFERTKRDAPFFIAALVALLLLPFLYKYSGQVEEQTFVTPGVDQDFVADYDYLPGGVITDNPDGEVAKYAGRDSIGLIAGMGGAPDSGMPPSMDSIDRNGLDDDYPSYTPPVDRGSSVRNQRQQAAPQTRGAFRRATQTPTKIGTLGDASMAGRSGSLAVGPWGGALKESAARVRNSGPKQGPKPVSLQPLQAAGKPSRSYFGVGNAKQARDSKDALSKGNALQALKDAQFNPINPGVIGGISGADGQRGGGNANMPNSGAFKGMKPWWWDLMAQRSQHDWLWKRNLWQKPITMLVEAVAKGLADMFAGLLGCLFTGEDDWSMGSMWGTSEGSGSKEGCKIAGSEPQTFDEYCTEARKVNDPFGLCASDKNTFKNVCKQMQADGKRKWEWVSAKGAGGNLNWFQKRLHCMGATVKSKGKTSRTLEEVTDCTNLVTNDSYMAHFSSNRDKKDWAIFHYVVGIEAKDAGAYFGTNPHTHANTPQRQSMLKVFYMNEGPRFSLKDSSYVNTLKDGKYIPLFVEAIALKKNVASQRHPTGGRERMATGKKTNVNNDALQAETESALDYANRLVFVTKDNKAAGWPMDYSTFLDTFNKGINKVAMSLEMKKDKDGNVTDEYKKAKKAGGEGDDWLRGAYCEIPLARISCQDNALSGYVGSAETDQHPYAILQTYWKDDQQILKNQYAVYYSVMEDGKYPTAMPPVKKINLYDNKAFSQPYSVGNNRNTSGAYSDGGSYYYDVISDITKPSEKGPVYIRWSVRQTDGINMGAGKNDLGTALPGTEVSAKYCTYFSDESNFSTIQQNGCTEDVVPYPEYPNCKLACNTATGQYASTLTGDCPEIGGVCRNGEKKYLGNDTSSPCYLECKNGQWDSTHFTPGLCGGSGGSGDIHITLNEDCRNGDTLSATISNAAAYPDCKWTCVNHRWQSPSPDDCPPSDPIQFPGGVTLSTTFSAIGNGINDTCSIDNLAVPLVGEEPMVGTLLNLLDDKLKQEGKRLVRNSGQITTSQLVDAIVRLNQSVNVNVACMLGKSIGFASVDNTAGIGGRNEEPPAGYTWNNMFGTFAAFIDEESSFFPGHYVKWGPGGTQAVDARFTGCHADKTTDTKYHYGYYNWNNQRLQDLVTNRTSAQDDRVPFEQAAYGAGATAYWKEKPLRSIARSVGFTRNTSYVSGSSIPDNGTLDDQNRIKYHDKYKKVFQSKGACGLTGGTPVTVNQIKSYINTLCQYGAQIKPTNGEHLNCSHHFAASPVPIPQARGR